LNPDADFKNFYSSDKEGYTDGFRILGEVAVRLWQLVLFNSGLDFGTQLFAVNKGHMHIRY